MYSKMMIMIIIMVVVLMMIVTKILMMMMMMIIMIVVMMMMMMMMMMIIKMVVVIGRGVSILLLFNMLWLYYCSVQQSMYLIWVDMMIVVKYTNNKSIINPHR